MPSNWGGSFPTRASFRIQRALSSSFYLGICSNGVSKQVPKSSLNHQETPKKRSKKGQNAESGLGMVQKTPPLQPVASCSERSAEYRPPQTRFLVFLASFNRLLRTPLPLYSGVRRKRALIQKRADFNKLVSDPSVKAKRADFVKSQQKRAKK